MDLEESDIERLAFIKELYQDGIENSKKPLPVANKSILNFHDAVELFLLLLIEKKGANEPGNLKGYLNTIEQAYNKDIDHESTVRTLIDARGTLKHRDVKVDESTIQALRQNLKPFFQQNSSKFLNVDFQDISLIHLVEFDEVKSLLEDAEELKSQDKKEESIKKIAKSYQVLIDSYEENKTGKYGSSPFRFGRRLRTFDVNDGRSSLSGFSAPNADILEKTVESVNSIQDALRVLSLGIDYRKYAKFDSLAPTTTKLMNGGITYSGGKEELSDEDIDFCKEFVIECALKLQKFDFELD